MEYKIEVKGIQELIGRLEAATKETTIKKALSQPTFFLAKWAADNRIANINPNRKQVLADKLTARSSFGYKHRIFGQGPSEVEKSGNIYKAKFGTNVNNKGFSYPRLHEYGGKFHPPRPVLTPAIQDAGNQRMVIDVMTKAINEALEGK